MHNFESLAEARFAIGKWIEFYNNERPLQALKMKSLAEAYALAA